LVDYGALAEDRTSLDRYLAQIAEIGPETEPERFPGKEHRLAYYLNAYNALVFEGVLRGYPDDGVVWAGPVPGQRFFDEQKFRLDGRSVSLNQIEHQLVRANFGDARVHAALNCASLGCPRLPREPFEAERLDRQLDDAMVEFVSDHRFLRVDAGARTVFLSKIFEWFEEDFLADEREAGNDDPKLIDYVNRFRREVPDVPRAYTVRFSDYDKRLNAQR
jgi:hypothetical protein